MLVTCQTEVSEVSEEHVQAPRTVNILWELQLVSLLVVAEITSLAGSKACGQKKPPDVSR